MQALWFSVSKKRFQRPNDSKWKSCSLRRQPHKRILVTPSCWVSESCIKLNSSSLHLLLVPKHLPHKQKTISTVRINFSQMICVVTRWRKTETHKFQTWGWCYFLKLLWTLFFFFWFGSTSQYKRVLTCGGMRLKNWESIGIYLFPACKWVCSVSQRASTSNMWLYY